MVNKSPSALPAAILPPNATLAQPHEYVRPVQTHNRHVPHASTIEKMSSLPHRAWSCRLLIAKFSNHFDEAARTAQALPLQLNPHGNLVHLLLRSRALKRHRRMRLPRQWVYSIQGHIVDCKCFFLDGLHNAYRIRQPLLHAHL